MLIRAEKLRVLMVEDNRYDAELAIAALRSGGYDVECKVIRSGEEFTLELNNDYDIVICDHGLPGFNAVEALDSLLISGKDFPFLIVSGTINEDVAIECMRRGASDYLLKDRLARLPHAVRRSLQNAKLRNDAKQKDQLLRENEERYRVCVESIENYALILLDVYGNITMWNTGAKSVFGYDRDEVLGRSYEILYPDQYVKDGIPAQHLAQAAAGIVCLDGVRKRKDGATISASFRVYSFRSFDGELKGYSLVASDISERVKLENTRAEILQMEKEARAKAEDAWRAAEKANRLKDEFLSVISHELRTPLGAIVGWSDLLLRGRATGSDRQTAIEVIHRNANSQLRIIEDLLDAARILSGKLSIKTAPVDLSKILHDEAESMRVYAQPKNILLKVICKPVRKVILADPARLKQIIGNLTSNAIKFSRKGGTVYLRLEEEQDGAKIMITDEGEGIDPEFIPDLFERFRQEDSSKARAHGGLGLGLAIARHLVDLHGGKISVESKGKGYGATFSVILPDRSQSIDSSMLEGFYKDQEEAFQEASLGEQKILTGANILLIEDDVSSMEVAKMFLENAGACVVTSNSALAAFEMLRDYKADLIICDVGLPEMDGNEFMREVRRLPFPLYQKVPALALTAYAAEEDRKRCLESGFTDYLSKPTTQTRLISKVWGLLRHTEKGREIEIARSATRKDDRF